MRGSYTRGVLFVHSTPPALCPHIEWALGTALGQEVHLQWSDQEAAPGMVRCEFSWVGPIGSAPVWRPLCAVGSTCVTR